MQINRWNIMLWVVLVSMALLFFSAGDAMALKVGDKAPDFTLSSTTGEKISLSQFRGEKPVVLFFYIFAFGGA
jgi:cytochrome oxidase Cu insertion factor (SCO1/SenC/PrrC family)